MTMKKKLESFIGNDRFLKPYYKGLEWAPTTLDLEETFHYFTSKYEGGLHKKSQDYYLFWALMKYPYPNKEDIEDGIQLQLKKVTDN